MTIDPQPTEKTMNELIIIENVNATTVFTQGGLDAILNDLAERARSIVLDGSTAKGRDEIRTIAARLAKSRTALFKAAKELREPLQADVKVIMAESNRMEEFMKGLEAEIRKPLTDFETAEKERIAAHEAALAEIAGGGDRAQAEWQTLPIETMQDRLTEIMNGDGVRDWQEFKSRADRVVEEAANKIRAAIEQRTKYDAEQAELARLRAEQVAREQQERDKKIADEAAEKARLDAEAKAKAEADRQEKLAEQARQEVERQKEKAERDLKEANERAEKAAQAERDKIAAEQKAEADAIAKREADLNHKKKINGEILLALTALNGVLTDEAAKEIITAIATGKIPHVKIQY